MPVAWVLSRGPSVVTAVCRRDLSLYTPPWRHRYMFYTQYLTWCFNKDKCDSMTRRTHEVALGSAHVVRNEAMMSSPDGSC